MLFSEENKSTNNNDRCSTQKGVFLDNKKGHSYKSKNSGFFKGVKP